MTDDELFSAYCDERGVPQGEAVITTVRPLIEDTPEFRRFALKCAAREQLAAVCEILADILTIIRGSR